MKRFEKLALRKKVRDMFPHADDTILIEIPACKDPELLHTVTSALIQSDVPDRIHFAVCYQDDDIEQLLKLRAFNHMRVTHVPLADAKGACYARHLCQQLYDGEDFVMTIDGHMRFIKHWDTALLGQWYACSDKKGIISFYPHPVRDWWLQLPLDDPAFDNPYPGGRITMPKWADFDNRRPSFGQIIYRGSERLGAVIRDKVPFLAGGYAFGPGIRSVEVKYDPYMWYCGDEFPQGIRLFTYGYNIYTSEYCYALHHYCRGDIRHVPAVKGRDRSEYARIKTLMGVSDEADLGQYGPGDVRTVEDYQMFAGIDFSRCDLQDKAVTGVYGFEPVILDSKPVVSDEPVRPILSANDISMCAADKAVYLGMASDKTILPWMHKTGCAWASYGMGVFQRLAERFYGTKTGEPGLFCDIGANIGTTCIHFAKNIDPAVDILAFEPVPKLYDILRANAAVNGIDPGRFKAVNAGVSDRNGMSHVAVSSSNPGGSQIASSGIPIRTVRFDDYLFVADIDINRIKYIWVDIEGFEGAFLSGAMDTLSSTSVPIVLEFTPVYLARNGHAKMFLDAINELYESFVYIDDKSLAVRPVSELSEYFNDDFSMRTYTQKDIFMVRKGLS